MSNSYEATGRNLYLVDDRTGEQELAAQCDSAGMAAVLLNKSMRLNAARKYTASARAMHEAACLPGFAWVGAMAGAN